MTVLDQILEVQDEIKKLRDAKGLHQFSNLYETRRGELETQRVAFEKTMAKVVTLAVAGVLQKEGLPSHGGVAKLLGKVSAILDDPTKLTQGHDFRSLREQLDALTRQLTTRVENNWTTFSASYTKPNRVLLEQIARVPDCAARVAELTELIDRLTDIEARTPSTQEEFNQYLDTLTSVKEAFQSLNPEQFPKDVLEFFQSSQSKEGAPWDQLTDDVLTWIRDKGLLDKLRIKIAP